MAKSSRENKKRTIIAAGSVVALLAFGGAAFATAEATKAQYPVVSEKVQQYYDENVANAQPGTSAPTQTLKVGDFQAVAQKLRAGAQPFTITVIGDSTGYPKQGWVEFAAESLSKKLSRTVTVSVWNQDTSSYDVPHSYGSGEPAVTIWNGSASGKDPVYSMANLSKLNKGPSDLVVINHGHNVQGTETVRTLMYQVANVSGGAAMAVVKQNPRTDPGAPGQEDRVGKIAGIATSFPGVQLLDVHKVFPADPAPWLSADGVHPNNQGYRAWADVFLASVGL